MGEVSDKIPRTPVEITAHFLREDSTDLRRKSPPDCIDIDSIGRRKWFSMLSRHRSGHPLLGHHSVIRQGQWEPEALGHLA